jgi:hypothetical protein
MTEQTVLGYAVVLRENRKPVCKLYTRLGNAKNARTQLVGQNYTITDRKERKADQQRRAAEKYAILPLTAGEALA